MKTIAKAAFGALALITLGAVAASPAGAATSFGFSFGAGPYYGGYYGGAYYADPCFRSYRFRPAYCYRPGPAYWYGRPYYRGYPYRYRDYDRRYWRRWR